MSSTEKGKKKKEALTSIQIWKMLLECQGQTFQCNLWLTPVLGT